MAEKMTCPGCNAHLSSVLMAFVNGQPCPNCGLSFAAASEILDIQRSRADEALRERLTDAIKRADTAETKARKLERHLARIKSAVEQEEPDDGW